MRKNADHKNSEYRHLLRRALENAIKKYHHFRSILTFCSPFNPLTTNIPHHIETIHRSAMQINWLVSIWWGPLVVNGLKVKAVTLFFGGLCSHSLLISVFDKDMVSIFFSMKRKDNFTVRNIFSNAVRCFLIFFPTFTTRSLLNWNPIDYLQ